MPMSDRWAHLGPVQKAVLCEVARYPGYGSGFYADGCGISEMRASRILGQLEQRGLIDAHNRPVNLPPAYMENPSDTVD